MQWKPKPRLPKVPGPPGGGAASRACPARRGNDRGAILLLVLLVLAFLSLLILSWAREWRLELKLAENFRESRQCRRLAEAGVYYALGKVVMAKAQERTVFSGTAAGSPPPGEVWWGDQRPHLVEMPGGLAEVRVADEAGKINLNSAHEESLTSLFTVLGFGGPKLRTMVDSLLDWRSQEAPSRPLGAKNDYYLRLNPPYVAKNGKFEVVEELAWVRGFEGLALLPRLCDWLTATTGGGAINLNTAPLEVLLALGFPPDVAQTLVLRRQVAPLRNLQDLPPLSQTQMRQPLAFQSSRFFTIKSTGMINKGGGRHTIKVLVQITPGAKNMWDIVSWVDDFPG